MIAVDNYYTNIPGEIMGDSKINFGAKLLFGRIQSLSHKEGFCWSCNKYLAKLMGVSIRTIQRWIESLKENNYIKSEIIYKEGTKEVACRKLLLNSMTPGGDTVVMGGHDTDVTVLINNNTNKDYYSKKERNLYARAYENSINVDDEINKTLERIKSLEKYLENIKNTNQDCTQTKYADEPDLQLSEVNREIEKNQTQYENNTEPVTNDSMSTYGRESFDDITSRKISYTEERVNLGKYLAFIICRFGKITNDMWEAFLNRYLSLSNSVQERLANLAYSLSGGYSNIFPAPKSECKNETKYAAISMFE